jgi:DNA-binding transcriptional regulator YiaG
MFNSPESARAAPSIAMAKKGRPAIKPQHEEIPGQASRLRRLRDAYHFASASAFAATLGIPVTTYNSFENGAPLSRQAAFKIVQKIPGITLDWLYFDKPDGLPLDVLRRLGLLEPPGKRRS